MQSQNTARIPLYAKGGSIRAYALIDATDAEWANRWRWFLNNNGYAARSQRTGGKTQITVLLHRALLGLQPEDGFEGDHRNRVRLDCRRTNLLAVLKSGKPNAQNQGSVDGSSSIYRGVSWHKRIGKWQARLRVNWKDIHVGYFADEKAAADAAREARARLMPFAVD